MDGASPITTPINVRITIQSGPSSGVIWVEDHALVDPDASGLINLVIGTGVRNSSSTVGSFSDINWTVSPKYIKTEIEYGGWQTMGAAQLWSVPYAMVSKSAFSGVSNPFSMNGDTVLFSSSVGVGATNLHKARLAVKGDKIITNDDPLFEVRRSDGKTVFAVYNEGIRMYVADRTAKGAKGGFAIGGFDVEEKADVQEYLTITPYETRINMNPPLPGKAPKGGFAIGEFGAKGLIPTNFMDVTPKNYFIGHESGTLIDGGLFNSVIGYQAGKNLLGGYSNTIFGNTAGLNISNGDNNIVIGDAAGFLMNTGKHNTLIGSNAGHNHTDQMYNIMIGTSAGYNVNSAGWNGSFNTFVGINAGYKIKTSKENTFIGTNAGYMLENGTGNTIVGIDAGRGGPDDPTNYYGYTTNSNTMLGNMAGYNLLNGSGNVFIGYQAGYFETGSIGSPVNDKLYIANSSGTPLIYGDFSSARIGLGTVSPGYKLDVVGDINISTGSNFKINGVNISAATLGAEPVLTKGNLTATGPVSVSATRQIIGGAAEISISDASTSGKGAVQLSNSFAGTSQTLATTEKALSEGLATKVTGAGVSMGKINLTGTGNIDIISIAGGTFSLKWEVGNWIEINNTNSIICNYWYQKQDGVTSTGDASFVNAGTNKKIITGISTNNTGFEIHFGQADGTAGWCSVWLQYYNGALTGHYIMN